MFSPTSENGYPNSKTDFNNFEFSDRKNVSHHKNSDNSSNNIIVGKTDDTELKSSIGLNSPLSLSDDLNIENLALADKTGKSNKKHASQQQRETQQALGNEINQLDNDELSLSSISVTSSNKIDGNDSLIFERFVQDPLIDAQPIPHSLPRHISCETFIPASLDTTTHIIHNPDSNKEGFEPIEFGFNSRRSSIANLEAALNSNSNSRKSSCINLNLQSNSYRKNSISTNSLSRTNTNSSFSNLTQQFQNINNSNPNNNSNNNINTNNNNNYGNKIYSNPKRVPNQQQPSNSINSLPSLTTSLTSPCISSRNNVNTPPSPSMQHNRSFCSYADIINQDDYDSRYSIRRPSLSASLSTQKMVRTNSVSSQTNIQRTPTNPITNSNANVNSISMSLSNSNSTTISPFGGNLRNNIKNRRGSSIRSPNTSSINNKNFSLDSDSEFDSDSIFATSMEQSNSKKSNNNVFPGRSSYSMKVSSSATSQNIDNLLVNKDQNPNNSIQ